jgi:hypothetical protein
MAISSMLYRMYVKQGEGKEVEHVVAMIDIRAHRAMTNIGIPFEPMHGYDKPFEYWESPETLAFYTEFKNLMPGVTAFYNKYHRSWQQIRDYARYLVGDRKSEKGKAAMKRIGLGRVAGMIATGKNIDHQIALDR